MNTFKKIFLLSFFLTGVVFSSNNPKEIKSDNGHYVSVRGVAQKIIPADMLKLTITFWDNGEEIQKVNQKMKDHQEHIKNILVKIGFEEAKIDIHPYQVMENTKIVGSGPKKQSKTFSKVTGKLIAKTCNINLGHSISQKIMELADLGIKYKMDMHYILSDVEFIRSEMQSEALKNAQNSACEFAKNSHMELGKVKSADHHGYFTITSVDSAQDHDQYEKHSKMKKVKFSTSVQYELK